ncbi:MAG: hypothetical protein U0802_23420 [Candidatus Binatia bacterium]
MDSSASQRAFLLLRYTLIAATAYLLMVEDQFALPSLGSVLVIAAALTSNVILAQLPPRITQHTSFGIALVVGDTVWITALLVQSGRFNAEFFYLYFFVLLLAAIGENLRLIAVGAVAICGAYLYGLAATGGTWSWWQSPSLIRIPFLFTAAAFYGFLVERTRSERWRAEAVEGERQRIEDALSQRTAELRDEAAVSAALARVGSELISSLDRPVLLERVCQVTTQELGAASSHTLLRRADEAFYVSVAAHGLSPETRELVRLLEIPQQRLAALLLRLDREGVAEVEAPMQLLPGDGDGDDDGYHLLIALRRGPALIGLQVANWRERPALTETQCRIARGIGQLASMALTNAQLVHELAAAAELGRPSSMSRLRTPLNLIIGYGDICRSNTFPVTPSVADRHPQAMARSSHARERLDLVEATLDLSRLEARRMHWAARGSTCRRAVRRPRARVARVAPMQPGVELSWDVAASCAAARSGQAAHGAQEPGRQRGQVHRAAARRMPPRRRRWR